MGPNGRSQGCIVFPSAKIPGIFDSGTALEKSSIDLVQNNFKKVGLGCFSMYGS